MAKKSKANTCIYANTFICAWCRRYYNSITRKYIHAPKHGKIDSHGICEDCLARVMREASLHH